MLSTIPYSGGFANKNNKIADISARILQKHQRLISKYSVKTYVVILVVYAVQRFRLSS